MKRRDGDKVEGKHRSGAVFILISVFLFYCEVLFQKRRDLISLTRRLRLPSLQHLHSLHPPTDQIKEV